MSKLTTLIERIETLTDLPAPSPAADPLRAAFRDLERLTDPAQRLQTSLSLLAGHPYQRTWVDAELVGGAITLGVLGSAVLCWDLLQRLHCVPGQPATRTYQHHARRVAPLLSGDDSLLALAASERFYDAIWQLLDQQSDAADSDPVTQAKRHGVRHGTLTSAQSATLLAAVRDHADIDAVVVLEHCDAWPDPRDESMAIACSTILSVADAALVSGYSGYATFLLGLLDELEDDDEGDAVLGAVLLDAGLSAAARQVIARIDVLNPGLTDDVRLAPPIRLALAEGRHNDALILAQPYIACDAPDALARRAPLLTVAVVETCIALDVDTPLLAQLPAIAERDPLCVEAATALADAKCLALWLKGAGADALAPFVDPLLRFPASPALWQRFHDRVALHNADADSVAPILLTLTERYGDVLDVWLAVAACPALSQAQRARITDQLQQLRQRQQP